MYGKCCPGIYFTPLITLLDIFSCWLFFQAIRPCWTPTLWIYFVPSANMDNEGCMACSAACHQGASCDNLTSCQTNSNSQNGILNCDNLLHFSCHMIHVFPTGEEEGRADLFSKMSKCCENRWNVKNKKKCWEYCWNVIQDVAELRPFWIKQLNQLSCWVMWCSTSNTLRSSISLYFRYINATMSALFKVLKGRLWILNISTLFTKLYLNYLLTFHLFFDILYFSNILSFPPRYIVFLDILSLLDISALF